MGRLSRGNRNIRWIEAHCFVPEGRDVGKPVSLRPWQKKIIREIYNSPTRRGIISFGRKNAKTTLSGFLCLLHLVGPEARPNSQLFSAAQSRDQAGILFQLMAKMVRMNPSLNTYIVVRESAKQLYCPELGTLYRALSADASTAYGLSPVFVVHDELGQVKGPRSSLYDALETAAGAQDEPLSIVISTQAPTDGDLLSILIDDAATGEDAETKLFLYTADPELDPFKRSTIRKANPAFGDFLNEKEVLSQSDAARRMPAREASYRNLVLNQRITVETPFVAPAVWDANKGAPDPDAFERFPVSMGLDLSLRTDLTALAIVATDEDGINHVRMEFFAPKEGVVERSQRDRVPYDLWAERGFLTLTPGHSVDYEWVATRLADLEAELDIAELRFDRWKMPHLEKELERIGLELPTKEHGQGFKDMAPAVDTLEAELINERIRHGGNPVLTFCASNTIAVSDPAENRKFDKAKSTGRIDGMVALAMALASLDDGSFIEGELIAI